MMDVVGACGLGIVFWIGKRLARLRDLVGGFGFGLFCYGSLCKLLGGAVCIAGLEWPS